MELQIYKVSKEDALNIINTSHAFTEIKPEDVFVFGGTLSSQSRDSHYSRMTKTSIYNYKEDATKGFPLIIMHDNKPYPVGRVFKGEVSGTPTNRDAYDSSGLTLDVLMYIPRNLQVSDNLNTDNTIRGIETGVFGQLSIGFDCNEDKDIICSVCSQPLVDCTHIPGKRHNGNRAFYWVDNAHAREASLVSVGSNPDTKIKKTIRMREQMELEFLKTRLVAINPEYKFDGDLDEDKMFERVLDILADTNKKVSELNIEKERLTEKAKIADDYLNGLIEDAVKARVRANGQGEFDDEKYKGVLGKLGDIEYIRSEIKRWDDLATKVLNEGERTVDTKPEPKKRKVDFNSYKG